MRLFFFLPTGFLAFCACQHAAGKGVIIQNKGPRGGGYLVDASKTTGYTDAAGKHFGYAIFWTGITNKTAAPLELTINFPADSFAIFPSPGPYAKLFLLPDTMTPEKVSLYNYGVTGLKSFLATSFHTPTMQKKTIQPKEQFLFYVAMLN